MAIGHHPMVPADYTTPETIRALDDATRVGGAIAGLLAVLVGAWVGVRRWWHRKRDRQERVLREEIAALKDSLCDRLDRIEGRLDELHQAHDRHLEVHVVKAAET